MRPVTLPSRSLRSLAARALRRPALLAAAFASAALLGGRPASSTNEVGTPTSTGVYGHVPPDQVEFLSTKDRILSVARGNSPAAIWEALEHGERVECLDCIPAVAELLYDDNAETREIAAWWLRRRLVGVFGAGEVYPLTLGVLKSDPDPKRRARAADAIGEFLTLPGIDAVAEAIRTDPAPEVRAAAAKALGRLNDDGKGALARAFGDGDRSVKLAALRSAGRINVLGETAPLAALTKDADAVVRKRAAEVLGARRVKDAAPALIDMLKGEPDAEARGAACHALGLLGDATARPALEAAAQGDKDRFVRDLATMALRRL